ncbi:hypothetical protein B7L09_28085 [Pseudomonas mandelii]|uniref:hypothetical protein n=1 Tax=Pseudomonas TaxID=286 RepID=UPI000B963A4D|nr:MULTISPECIES: hypothetical protein [Pseudomonas]OYQ00881.1 hypothetical protein B7L09_28085 [Pseudomonas mandelii]
MILSLFKVVMITSALLLSACSGVSTNTCFSGGCQSFDGHGANKLSLGGSAIGSNFSAYSSRLLHED